MRIYGLYKHTNNNLLHRFIFRYSITKAALKIPNQTIKGRAKNPLQMLLQIFGWIKGRAKTTSTTNWYSMKLKLRNLLNNDIYYLNKPPKIGHKRSHTDIKGYRHSDGQTIHKNRCQLFNQYILIFVSINITEISMNLCNSVKTWKNKKHSENADTSTSVKFDLVVWPWPFVVMVKKADIIRCRFL